MKKQYETYLSPSLTIIYLQKTELLCASVEKEIAVEWDTSWDK